MLLCVMRHGIAHPREEPNCPPDFERPLTDKGRSRTRRAARGLRALGVRPDLILSSQLVRAVETAEIVADSLGVERSIELTDALKPQAEPQELLATLESLDAERVLCTGHAPNLDRVVSLAIGAPFGSIFLKKCGTACLEFSWGSGAPAELLWLFPPRALRQLGEERGR